MKKFLLPFQNMVRADLFSGSLAVWNALGFRIHFARPIHPSRAVRGEERIPFELIQEYTARKDFVGGMQNRRRFAPTIFLVLKPFSKNCGTFWLKSELFLTKIRTAKFDKNFSARAGKKEGGWGEGIFARPRFRRFFFHRHDFSYQRS